MPTTTLPTNSTAKTTSAAKSNATKSSPLPIVIKGSRYANAMGCDQMYVKRREDQRILFEHLSTKDTYGNYKPGSVHANENTVVFNEPDVRCDKSDARSDVAVRHDWNQIGEWKKDGDGKEQRTSMRNLRRSRMGGEVLGNTNQWMAKGTSDDLTTQQYHYPQIDRFERPKSAFRYGAASPTHPKQYAYLNIASSVSNVAFADSPNPLNTSNLNILNQQNELSSLKPPFSLAQSTSPAHSIASARATCSYENIDNKTVRAEGSIAAVALAIATASAAGAAAGKTQEELGCEHADGEGKAHITWGVVDTAEDHDIPNWELIDEVDVTEEWNTIDIIDRISFTRDVEGWSLL